MSQQQPTLQDMLNGVTAQTEQNAGGIYQSIMSNLANAANLAALPNWREVIEDEFETFQQEVYKMGAETKDALQHQVLAEQLLEVRGSVSSGMDRAISNAVTHKENLIQLIERLQVDPTTVQDGENKPLTSSIIDLD